MTEMKTRDAQLIMSNYDYNKFLSDSGDDYPTYEEVVRKYKAKKVLTDKQKPVSIKNNEIRNRCGKYSHPNRVQQNRRTH